MTLTQAFGYWHETIAHETMATPPSAPTTNDSDNSTTIDPPWMDDHQSLMEVISVSTVVIILSLLTAGGNLLVIVSFKMDAQLQTVSNYFLLSLSVADFAIGAVSMPLFSVYLLMRRWPLGAFVCDAWLSIDYTMSNASVANLLVISLDRYFSVTRPLTYRAKRTPTKAVVMICVAWGVSALLWTPWIFAWPYIEGQRTVPDGRCYIQFLQTNQYLTIVTAVAAYYLPVIIMAVLFCMIYRETEKRQKGLAELQGGAAGGGIPLLPRRPLGKRSADKMASKTPEEDEDDLDLSHGSRFTAQGRCRRCCSRIGCSIQWPFRLLMTWFCLRRRPIESATCCCNGSVETPTEKSHLSDTPDQKREGSVEDDSESGTRGRWMKAVGGVQQQGEKRRANTYSCRWIMQRDNHHRGKTTEGWQRGTYELMIPTKSTVVSFSLPEPPPPKHAEVRKETSSGQSDASSDFQFSLDSTTDGQTVPLIKMDRRNESTVDIATPMAAGDPLVSFTPTAAISPIAAVGPTVAVSSVAAASSTVAVIPVTANSPPAAVTSIVSVTSMTSITSMASTTPMVSVAPIVPVIPKAKIPHPDQDAVAMTTSAPPDAEPVTDILSPVNSRTTDCEQEASVEIITVVNQDPSVAAAEPEAVKGGETTTKASGDGFQVTEEGGEKANGCLGETEETREEKILTRMGSVAAAAAGRRPAMTMQRVVIQACAAAKLTQAVRAYRERKQHQEKKQERKAAKTLSAILLAFVLTWTPYNVFIVVQAFCSDCIPPTLYDIGQYLVVTTYWGQFHAVFSYSHLIFRTEIKMMT